MATSRTGTGAWKRVRDQALAMALERGQHACPICRRPMDWTRSLTPRSPEVDHIKPHALGGKDTLDNVRVICRECNGKLGAQTANARRALRMRNLKRTTPPTAFDW